MPKTDKPQKENSPIVNISLIKYDSGEQDQYSKKFMSPLIEGLLRRVQWQKLNNHH